MSTLRQLAQQRSSLTPNKIFINQISTEEKISYGRLWETSQQIANSPIFEQLAEGSRIGLIARNHWIWLPLLIACSIRKFILVPIDPTLHPDEMAFVLSHSGTSFLVFDENFKVQISSKEIPQISVSDLLRTKTNDSELPRKDAGNADPGLLMIYTSGTTGGGKGVLLTEKNLVTMANLLCERYQINDSDRFFCMLPTFHMNAVMMTGLLPLTAGAEIFLSDILSFQNAKKFWENLDRYQITICSLVPSIMSLLLSLFKKTATSHVPRFGFCGTAPLSSELWQNFEQEFGFPIYQGYGLTETTCWAAAIPLGAKRYDSVGQALGCEFRVDSNGEILIRGATVMKEYYKDEVLTKALFTSDGFFRTGDLGAIDSEGFVKITGRLKEIIIRKGMKISSNDIDNLLLSHPSIQEAKTIGVPDPMVGEKVHTVCVLKPGAKDSKDSIMSWLRARISEYKYPDQMTLMGDLPKTRTNKISIFNLKKILSGEITK